MTDTSHPRTSEACWVLVPPEAVPARWRARTVPMAMVGLLPEEAQGVLSTGGTLPALTPEEQRLGAAIAMGHPVSSAARRLGMPLRTVQRRLARLRERLGVGSTHELALLLARHGYGQLADAAPAGVAGDPRPEGEHSDNAR